MLLRYLAVATVLAVGACDSQEAHVPPDHDDGGRSRPHAKEVERWPLDLRLDIEIERIVELRGRAQQGHETSLAKLGPDLDAEEAALWRARRDERERLALARLFADGLVDGMGRSRADQDALRARFEEARHWSSAPAQSRHFEAISRLGYHAATRQFERERALALAEMAILRRLIAASVP